MEFIQSKQNNRVKQWRKLHTSNDRQQQAAYLIEGVHLLEEAIAYSQPIQQVMVTSDYYQQMPVELLEELAPYLVMVSEDVARAISMTEQPQGVFAVVSIEREQTWRPTGKKYLLVDAVQDPGNVGTMIRTADAAGYDGVVLGKGTVDVYNDKVLRSTQGSLWHLEVVTLELETAIHALKQQGVPLYATALHQEALAYNELPASDKVALIVGNEGKGVSQTIIDSADKVVYIPMKGKAESLNVAIAAGILMFTLGA